MTNAIVLFRNDLRISHNPALYHAAQEHQILPVYILDDDPTVCDLGGANKVWLHQSLMSLDQSLGKQLCLYRGHTQSILERLVQEYDISAIYWNRRYTPYHIEQDKTIKAHFKDKGIAVHSYKANLLKEPWECLKADHSPYVVFTPFYKKNYLSQGIEDQPLPAPDSISYVPGVQATQVNDLKLLTHKPWEDTLLQYWAIGEDAARRRFLNFIDTRISTYKDGRNFPAQTVTSELSP
ncbi:MAG: deoxyribodipyrimidine photo-lyase, partial [Alphaproteobacteria bacterium]|nr:deoxyribodipyrimidine photo-lyase [Alphaproteobacteria bacterium]